MGSLCLLRAEIARRQAELDTLDELVSRLGEELRVLELREVALADQVEAGFGGIRP